jgi:DNA-binding NarL/FixJ family response regulator
VLALIAEGLSDAAIAQQLGIAVGTARWHTKRILAKLGVSNRTQAALAAHERHTGQNP